jgi:hypothetical protein
MNGTEIPMFDPAVILPALVVALGLVCAAFALCSLAERLYQLARDRAIVVTRRPAREW